MKKANFNDVQNIKQRLGAAAAAAERAGSPLSTASWGYFAPDVLRLIEDHNKLQDQVQRLTLR